MCSWTFTCLASTQRPWAKQRLDTVPPCCEPTVSTTAPACRSEIHPFIIYIALPLEPFPAHIVWEDRLPVYHRRVHIERTRAGLGFEPRTFLLWGNRGTKCNVSPWAHLPLLLKPFHFWCLDAGRTEKMHLSVLFKQPPKLDVYLALWCSHNAPSDINIWPRDGPILHSFSPFYWLYIHIFMDAASSPLWSVYDQH